MGSNTTARMMKLSIGVVAALSLVAVAGCKKKGGAAGEAMASPDERAPWTKNAYSIRSMAQTRAMSRAASSRLRYIPTLAGFSGTPAEEMPRDEPAPVKGRPMSHGSSIG